MDKWIELKDRAVRCYEELLEAEYKMHRESSDTSAHYQGKNDEWQNAKRKLQEFYDSLS